VTPTWDAFIAQHPEMVEGESVVVAKSRNKYGAVETVKDGQVFASKVEAHRWQDLRLMELAGVITGLVRQPCYRIMPRHQDCYGNWHRAAHYTADFLYQQDGRTIVEDVKGTVQRDAGLRIEMLAHQNPQLDVRIVRWDERAGWVSSGMVPREKGR
jgi:hypothetical protein